MSDVDRQIQQLRATYFRDNNKNPAVGILGTADGALSDPAIPGNVWGREWSGDGQYSTPRSYLNALPDSTQIYAGMNVKFGWVDGQPAVIGKDHAGIRSAGGNPSVLPTPYTSLQSVTAFLVTPTNPTTMFVQVLGDTLVVNDLTYTVPTASIDLTNIEAALATGEHCYAVIYLLATYAGYEVEASIGKSILLSLDDSDIDACHALKTAGSRALWAIEVQKGQTSFENNDVYVLPSKDLRPFFTPAPASGPGTGSVTTVSVVTANGISGSVANPSTTPAITLTLGAIVPTSVAVTGTGGAGFIGLPTQSSAPSAPASGLRMYADATGRLSWRQQSDTYVRTIGGVLSADRVYTLPNYDGTFATLAGTEVFANKTLTLPVITDYTNGPHTHLNAAGGGMLDAAAIASGTLAQARTDYAPAVIITPGATARNTITPSGAAIVPLTLNIPSGSANLLQLQNNTANAFIVNSFGYPNITPPTGATGSPFLVNMPATVYDALNTAAGNLIDFQRNGTSQFNVKLASIGIQVSAANTTLGLSSAGAGSRTSLISAGIEILSATSASAFAYNVIVNQQTSRVGVVIKAAATTPGDLIEWQSSAAAILSKIDSSGNLGVRMGSTALTAYLHLAAGTTAASTGPLKFTSGSLMTAAEAGAVEFLTDKAYLTITTGAARKEYTLNDAALTSGKVPVATTNGRLADGFAYDGTTLSVTKLALVAGSGSGAPKVGGTIFDHHADAGNTTILGADDTLYTDTVPANTLATNDDKVSAEYGGIFVSSATATREIKIWFGGTAIFDTGTLTLSLSSAWTVYMSIIRVSATVVRYMVSFTTEGAALSAYTAVGELTGLTLSNTNVLKITGAAAGVGAAANDIVAKMGTISWQSAA